MIEEPRDRVIGGDVGDEGIPDCWKGDFGGVGMDGCAVSDDSGTASRGALGGGGEDVWRILSILLAKFVGKFLAKTGRDDRSGLGCDS